MARRRLNGEGSIFKRKDGRWVGVVQVGYENGRRSRKVVYGATKSEVANKTRDILENARKGLVRPGRSPRLDEFLNQWLQTIEGTIRTSTFVSYATIARKHLVPSLGPVSLDRLTIQDVAGLLAQKRKEGLSPRTVQYILFIFRGALNKAMRWGAVSRNVALLVDPPRVAHRDVNVLSPDEALRLMAAAREDRLEGLWVLALSTGLRRGELRGLQWADTDLDRRRMRRKNALRPGNAHGLVLKRTQTRRGRRTRCPPHRNR